MSECRIHKHPILSIEAREEVDFTWQGAPLKAQEGEMISSALFANGIRVFGQHPKDKAPQGIFCANGQCAQCLVLVQGRPVKSCMTPLRPGMQVNPVEGLPRLPQVTPAFSLRPIETVKIPVLIIGGGPAGMSAAVELGRRGIGTLLIDDKHRLGGKLVLQTHRFFGSLEAVHAGTRGIDIATLLEEEARRQDPVEIWLNSVALGVFSDHKVGVLQENVYKLIEPRVLLVAAGAREKNLVFNGNTLPGVYGAGAFQTLVNRDLVRAAERLFIVGGGNVGLIAGYHALQAGIDVAGLAEAMPEVGGYKVHKDKLVRMGVPVYLRHTVVSANGKSQVESVTIAEVDESFSPLPGTEKSFACDTLLIAVGLDPVDEFLVKAKEFGLPAFAAGDAQEIAEASAAMFSGKISGLEVAKALGEDVGVIPQDWYQTAEILKSKPGRVEKTRRASRKQGVFPVLHCHQEIPCNPCTSVCPNGLIHIDSDDIRKLPEYREKAADGCTGCQKCVVICPALAVTLVDYRKDADLPIVTLPYEFLGESIAEEDRMLAVDEEGEELGQVEVVKTRTVKRNDRTILVTVRAPSEFAEQIAGIQVQGPWIGAPMEEPIQRMDDETIICRCERVKVGEIRGLIQKGVRDMNEVKAVTRAGMGSCGGKTCAPLILRLFREEGIPPEEVTQNIQRPLFMEVPLGVFAGLEDGNRE